MTVEASGNDLVQAVALLAAGVVAVPTFKRLGLGSVLGYLTAGLAIGPFGLGLFTDPQAILHVAELGVVMFLFVIGLEMQPSRLWSLRHEIFGLGAAQVIACGALLTVAGIAAGFAPLVAFVVRHGFRAVLDGDRHANPRTSAAKRQRRAASAPCRSCCWRIWRSCRCWQSSPSWRRAAPKPARSRAGWRSASRWLPSPR